LLIKYTGEIEGQCGSQEDPKKLAVIWEIPGNTGELVTLCLLHFLQRRRKEREGDYGFTL
jgi:hypothetical protein